jgi:3-deoxy-D-manno-octulosonic-acid transferase
VRALAGRLRERRPGLPLAASAVTPAGRRSLPSPPEVDAAFFGPLDFAGWPSRALAALRPAAVVLVETELWPNLLSETTARGVALVIANGRLSGSRMRRYRAVRGLLRPSLARVAAVGARSAADAARFVELGAGAERVEVTGDLKYDLDPPAADERETRRELGIPDDVPVWVAGSTGPREEGAVLDAWSAARAASPGLVLVLAPRHLERRAEVERAIRERGHAFRRASEGGALEPGCAVLLLDTIGQLAGAYRTAAVAFVGGSLVPVGGHNLLEPASLGVPVLFGPHVENVAETADALTRAGGARCVGDAGELGREVAALLADPSRRAAMGRSAESAVRAHRGSLDRTVGTILRAVDESSRLATGQGAA